MKDANDLIDEIVKGPNPLDKFMKQDPASLTVEDYTEVVAILRRDRATFIKTQAAKKDKKEGVFDPDGE